MRTTKIYDKEGQVIGLLLNQNDLSRNNKVHNSIHRLETHICKTKDFDDFNQAEAEAWGYGLASLD